MGSFGKFVSAILSKLAILLGINPSEKRRMEIMKQKLGVAKANNVDQMEALKDEIRQLETQALRKKEELDQAKGDSKRIRIGEIERTFREINRLHGRERIIASNMEKISIAQAKLRELEAAKIQGVEEGHLDDIALELQEVFADLKVADRAAKDLERVEYEAPEAASVNVEKRMAAVGGDKEAQPELSAETQKRLAELETEGA